MELLLCLSMSIYVSRRLFVAYRTVTKPYARSQKQISLPKQPASPSEHDPNHIGLTTSTDAHPPTQTTRCVFKQPLQPNRATIISNPRESHSIPSSRSSPKKKQTKPNQTKPLKQKPNTPSMLLQSSKNLHSTAAELRFCSRRAPHRRSHRSRHRKHVPPPDGPALGHGFRIGPDGMGGGGPSAGSVVFERNGLGGHQLVVLPVGTVLLHYYPKVLQTSTNRIV